MNNKTSKFRKKNYKMTKHMYKSKSRRTFIPTLFKIDLNRSVFEQDLPLHNRWHPDIPAVVSVDQNKIFKMECIDWTGGQIMNNDDACDIKNVDLTRVHYLSGPIHVNGAKPGDVLKVEILNVEPHPQMNWGFTGIFAKENGGGFLTDEYPTAGKAIWDFEGIFASSRHIPMVRFAGIIHPGLIGTAPSKNLLNEWTKRETKLHNTCKSCNPSLAELPNEKGALVGLAENTSHADKIKKEGARTVPGRENGGNCDIKNLTKGTVAYFPVYVNGANLSMGDIHFSQGDGEVSFCGAIETSGILTLRCSVISNGMKRLNITNPIFETSPLEPNYSKKLTFEGFSVDTDGKQHYLDATVAYKMACLNAIKYLRKFGYSDEQSYMILSCAPINGKISGIVDYPNAIATLEMPIDIFEMDISPLSKDANHFNHGQIPLCK
jgi:formamidase